ncbi:ABC transporter ATP-binding protein [Tenggerimyces flavus]|uniref:ABC transporter ATP-binding protein n=1 Tax=Tenggerimyces flavus TaxID=1708749 RepID=A0ABV7YK76_9ACTN|nr:ABC transporter ATP-binding protein [Tenggerimyces flavus]MBM7784899.1 ATP-binding cassette subfamily B protein [Tenggerimyces flavus]
MRSRSERARLSTLVAAVRMAAAAGRGLFVAVLALFAVAAVGIVGALVLGQEVLAHLIASDTDSGAGGGGTVWPLWSLLVAVVVVVAAGAFAAAAGVGLHRMLAERIMWYAGRVVLEAATRASLREFDTPEFHDRIQRIRRRGVDSPLMIAMAVPQLIAAVITSGGLVIGLAVIDPWLAPLTVLSGIPLWLSGRANSEEMYTFTLGSTPNDRTRQHLADILDSRRTAAEVRAFGLGDHLLRRWSKLWAERLAEIRVMVRRFVRRSAVGSLVSAVVLCTVFAVLLLLIQLGRLDVEAAAAACVAVVLLANRAQQAASHLAATMEHAHYLEEFMQLGGHQPDAAPASVAPVAESTGAGRAGVRSVEPFSALEVDDVCFAYPGIQRNVLESVSFTITAGEVVAIVGQNGSGKTTLAKLLCGLYPPCSGQVRWDNQPMYELMGGRGLDQIGVAFQDFGRYWFTAADNIGIGDVDRIGDRLAIARAAKEAGIHDVVRSLPTSYDTPLGAELTGGVDLSGGQWQRIALARLLFRRASFLVLDEPTASLDAEAEAQLFDTIANLRHGRTVVLISHRFSTIRAADRILVMHDGRLIEQGSHDQLLDKAGRYAAMYRLQAQAYAPT